nr:MFS transporter [Aquabacterium terrae]
MPADPSLIDSRVAAVRLLATLAVATLGNAAMYVLPVVLTVVQGEFQVSRSDASLPYTATMIGFGLGGVVCGRWADRHGVARVVQIGAAAVIAGFLLASISTHIVLFTLAHALLLGFLGIACAFVPLIADTGLWWHKRRGIAVAVCASGNYLAGAIWPPLVQSGIETFGWRPTYVVFGIATGVAMALLSLLLRQRPPAIQPPPAAAAAGEQRPDRPFGLQPGHAQALLFIAGIGCCVAMAMPQVHIVAYCTGLGYGPARGAQMLSLMLGFGIVSRLASGWVADRIGGVRTLLLGSALQCIALLLFLPFDGLGSLYVVSALFGLFQGGIVPSYAIIVREHFAVREAGARTGKIVLGTLIGMALGGWLSGVIFDATGSYTMAFVHGIAWNLINLSIVGWLFLRWRRGGRGVSRMQPA